MDRRRFLRLLGLLAVAGGARPLRGQGQDRDPAGTRAGVTLFLCGDVMTGRGIDQILPHPVQPRLYESYVKDARDYVALAERAHGPVPRAVDPTYVWGEALEVLAQVAPQARIINLETAVTRHNEPWPKGINYRMHPDNIDCLTAAKIDCCVLANNHVLDWGYAGLEQTLATLAEAGIPSTGAGATASAAAAPAILDVGAGVRVRVFSYALASSGISPAWRATAERPGVNLLPDLSDATVHRITAQVNPLKQSGDIVIASIHWGGNWGYAIPEEQRRFAHALIDTAGVDLIHGHSSHHVKGMEVYRGRPILYGCGDFLNDYEGIGGHAQYRGDLGLMYFPRLNPASGRLVDFQLHATRIKNLRVMRASAEETQWLLQVLNREGEALGTRVTSLGDGRLRLHWRAERQD